MLFLTLLQFISTNIFRNGYNESEILQLIQSVENQMRIFIYPNPKRVTQLIYERLEVADHFQAEKLFTMYLQKYRSHQIVKYPSQANAFFIDLRLEYALHITNMSINYVEPIIRNVVENYPFYNRSNGRDHFLFALFDQGILCGAHGYNNATYYIRKYILNAHFINNFGTINESEHGLLCHRENYDIPFPQMYSLENLRLHEDMSISLGSFRPFDSTFAGNIGNKIRSPLMDMNRTATTDYQIGLDNFKSEFHTRGNIDKTLLYQGYFMYAPCGIGCWSKRLYDAIATYTIPIFPTDGVYEPFERFIDWSKLAVKIHSSTWFNITIRNKFRRKLRYEADLFRNELRECLKLYCLNDKNLKDLNLSFSINLFELLSNCSRLRSNYLWQKKVSLQEAFQIFKFDLPQLEKRDKSTFRVPKKLSMPRLNAFAFLELEMWCHIRLFNQQNILNNPKDEMMIQTLCGNLPSETAYVEYF